MSGSAAQDPGGHTSVRPALETAAVVSNERLAEGVGLIALRSPRIAHDVRPGQFVHVRIAEGADFILRRPFSVHRVAGDTLELLYQVLGRGTAALAEARPGAALSLAGPLGSGWRVPDRLEHALLVAGGLGAAPLAMLAEELAERGTLVTVAYGAPTRDRLVARAVFDRVARKVEVATDDGSAGERGFVTALVERLLADDSPGLVYACGPELMERAVANLASTAGVPCQVSLERLMACGVGACLSCVVSTAEGPKRCCVEGPVFDAEEVSWDAAELPPKH